MTEVFPLITLIVNGLTSSLKRQILVKYSIIESMIKQYAVHKKLTLDPRTQTD